VLFADQSLDLALLEFGRRSIREAPVVRRASPNEVIGTLSLEDVSASVTERDE
jgi:hypothetical protein